MKNNKKSKSDDNLTKHTSEEKINPKDLSVLTKIKVIFSLLFILLILYLGNIMLYQRNDIIANPSNPLLDLTSEDIIRGEIWDKNGNILAYTDYNFEQKSSQRIYPYKDLFFHSIGYTEPIMEGVELIAHPYLIQPRRSIFEYIIDKINNNIPSGLNVYTTLDLELQQLSYDLLENYKGVVLVLEPTTGKILTMVSKPGVDPNKILSNYNTIRVDEEKPLLNRSTQGLYPPGSIFKIVSALSIINNGTEDSFSYDCKGVDYFNNDEIVCYDRIAHGLVHASDAFAYSCNTYFASAGVAIGYQEIMNAGEELLFNRHINLKFNTKTSKLTLDENSSIEKIAETSMGQGDTLMTPIHIAMITSAISNGGIIYTPYMFDSAVNEDGKIIKKNTPKIYDTILGPEDTSLLKDYMREVVLEGTAKNIDINNPNVKLYGKTGTAEAVVGNREVDHSWYVGFSESEKADIVVVVLVEEGGTSSRTAVPIARRIFETYYQQ